MARAFLPSIPPCVGAVNFFRLAIHNLFGFEIFTRGPLSSSFPIGLILTGLFDILWYHFCNCPIYSPVFLYLDYKTW